MNQSNSTSYQTVSPVGPYVVAAGDYSVLADATGGSYSVLLPRVASSSGRVVHVKKTDVSVNAIVVSAMPGELVEDAASQPLTRQGENLMLICDGSRWRVL